VGVTTPDEVEAQISSRGSAANGDIVSLLVRGSSGTRWLDLFMGDVSTAKLVVTPDFLKGVGPARNAAARSR
jgi:hypothetical protein